MFIETLFFSTLQNTFINQSTRDHFRKCIKGTKTQFGHIKIGILGCKAPIRNLKHQFNIAKLVRFKCRKALQVIGSTLSREVSETDVSRW